MVPAVWCCCFGQFHQSKIEKEVLSLSQFYLVAGFFEGMRENILYTYLGAKAG